MLSDPAGWLWLAEQTPPDLLGGLPVSKNLWKQFVHTMTCRMLIKSEVQRASRMLPSSLSAEWSRQPQFLQYGTGALFGTVVEDLSPDLIPPHQIILRYPAYRHPGREKHDGGAKVEGRRGISGEVGWWPRCVVKTQSIVLCTCTTDSE
jgi:hypothetical protein